METDAENQYGSHPGKEQDICFANRLFVPDTFHRTDKQKQHKGCHYAKTNGAGFYEQGQIAVMGYILCFGEVAVRMVFGGVGQRTAG